SITFSQVCGHGICTGYKTTGNQNRTWWPTLVIDLAYPIKKRNKISNLGFAEILFGHQATMFLFIVKFGGITHISGQIRGTAMLRDFSEIGCVVSAFTKKRMAINTIVFVPDVFAVSYLRRDGFSIGEFRELPVAVDCHYQKNNSGNSC